MRKFDSTLYFITDSTGVEENDFLEKVEAALKGGVTLLQLREKDRTTREYLSLAGKVHALVKTYNVPLIIDDRIDIAMAVHAEGVHLGQSDMPISIARSLVGKDMIIGATAKTVPQAIEAEEGGADYLGVGAIYPTTTHVKTVITPVSTLDEICASVDIAVNAIGGLNAYNLSVLEQSDISGICVVSAIMKAEDPMKAAKTLFVKAKDMRKRKLNYLKH